MTLEELYAEEARVLKACLDANHRELRAKELQRIGASDRGLTTSPSSPGSSGNTLADALREKKRELRQRRRRR
jgi:hypothetical protein